MFFIYICFISSFPFYLPDKLTEIDGKCRQSEKKTTGFTIDSITLTNSKEFQRNLNLHILLTMIFFCNPDKVPTQFILHIKVPTRGIIMYI